MNETRIFGEYALTPCKNAFKPGTSYWLSKNGMTVAMYCFSVNTQKAYDEMLKDIDSYIDYFQNKYEKELYNNYRRSTAKLIAALERERGYAIGCQELQVLGLSVIQYDALKDDFEK